jgi:hypothetical protein
MKLDKYDVCLQKRKHQSYKIRLYNAQFDKCPSPKSDYKSRSN